MGLQSFIDDRTEYGTIYFPGEACCDICAGKYLQGELKPGLEKGLSGFIWEADHPNQKLHKGYLKIREKLAELKEKHRQKNDRSRSREEDGKKKDSGRNGKEKESGSRRERSRTREEDAKKKDSGRNGREKDSGSRRERSRSR